MLSSAGRWCGARICSHHVTSLLVLLVLAQESSSQGHGRGSQHKEPEYWQKEAMSDLHDALRREENTNRAKNVILFVGDGMGLSTITAARSFKAKFNGKPELVWENFPNVALSKTYNIDHLVPDSAATATAFLCGVKANYGTLGLDGRAPRGHCRQSVGRNLTCIAQLAQQAGKATGVVTGARLTHATPAPLYAQSVDREWECEVPKHARKQGCRDIAQQIMSKAGANLNVVLGGGRRGFLPKRQPDPEYPDRSGCRSDERNLVEEWLESKEERGQTARYVWNQQQFDDVDESTVKNLIGLFEPSHMQYAWERETDKAGEPSLSDMVAKAINILSQNKDGYFLLVEGARIDHAHHYNLPTKALQETVALDCAVSRALDMVNLTDTLVIVTADHSSTSAGLSKYSQDDRGDRVKEVPPYSTFSGNEAPRMSSSKSDSAIGENSIVSTHEGTDVAIYASGPFSHLFHKTHEQTYVFHVMTYAACLGGAPRDAHCPALDWHYQPHRQPRTGSFSHSLTGSLALVLALLSLQLT